MRTRIKKKPMVEINVVPYIDTMLVLLVIFMITTPMLTQGVKIDLPNAQAQVLDEKQQTPIILTVDAKGNYFLNVSEHPDLVIAPPAVATRVAAELALAKQTGKQRQVLVKGDQNVDYGKVVQAMVLLQQAGAGSVGLMTQPDENHTQG